MQASAFTSTSIGSKPLSIQRNTNTNISTGNPASIRTSAVRSGASSYNMMSVSIGKLQSNPASIKSQAMTMTAPRSFLGQAPNAMQALKGRSIAAQAMHNKYSAGSRSGAVPNMMMGQQKFQAAKTNIPNVSIFTNMPTQRSAVKAEAASGDAAGPARRVAKSLVQEMSDAEKKEFNALPTLEIEDMEQVHYLNTIAEGWAFPLKRFMNEQEYIESMNMNTITADDGSKHILSVPITHHITAE
jgi:hypothetical protein